MLSVPFLLLNYISSLAFLGYGISCLGTEAMKLEFRRFKLSKYRVLIGTTQLLAASVLAVGPWFPVWGLIAAAGLSLQMLAGVGVRIQLKDSLMQTVQAAGFFFINLLLCLGYFSHL